MKYYVGHPAQTRGAEQYVMKGARAEGMNMLYLRNGLGLELWIALDRCADPYRVSFCGKNAGYMTPAGYVAPTYFNVTEDGGFLKNFTAGFLSTVGFEGAGEPCVDGDEFVPQHGRIGNTPAELLAIEETDEALTVKVRVRDCVIFGRRFILDRKYTLSYTENSFTLNDTVTNEGEKDAEFLLLYHANMGYPLLNENSIVRFPNENMRGCDEFAQNDIENAFTMEKPQQGYAERCFYMEPKTATDGKAHAGIFSPDFDFGVVFSFDKKQLPCLTEWKMMGRRDYVLGIEPGNCWPMARSKMREEGLLPFLKVEDSYHTEIKFDFTNNLEEFEKKF